MSRPTIKKELLTLGEENFQKLIGFIEKLSKQERDKNFPSGYLNRNIRDVLGHLHEWHLMMCSWYEVGMSGKNPDIPAKGYTWKTTPDLNREIQKKYSSIPLHEVKELLDSSFSKVRELIETHTDEELFEKKRYHWTGSTSLGAYFISATSSHYDWALKLIRKCYREMD